MKRYIALPSWTLAVIVALGSVALVSPSHAQIAVSANDNKVVNVNGAVKVVPNPPPDTVAIIDLKASPPRVIATLEAGRGPRGISINRQGTLALVSNREDGTVSIFTIQGKTVTPAGTVEVGGPKAGGGHVAITPDGKMALVSRDGDHLISVLAIDGTKVEYTKRDMTAGIRPVVPDIAPNGVWAVAGSLGQSPGNNDTASLIDLRARPPRVVDTISIGQTVEGIKVSPDGSVIAAVAQDGSNRAKESPFFNPGGKLVLLRVTGSVLSKVAEARIGHWPQGAAFSADGKTILVGNMIEKEYWVLQWDGATLRDTGQRVKVNGGPAAMRTAEK